MIATLVALMLAGSPTKAAPKPTAKPVFRYLHVGAKRVSLMDHSPGGEESRIAEIEVACNPDQSCKVVSGTDGDRTLVLIPWTLPERMAVLDHETGIAGELPTIPRGRVERLGFIKGVPTALALDEVAPGPKGWEFEDIIVAPSMDAPGRPALAIAYEFVDGKWKRSGVMPSFTGADIPGGVAVLPQAAALGTPPPFDGTRMGAPREAWKGLVPAALKSGAPEGSLHVVELDGTGIAALVLIDGMRIELRGMRPFRVEKKLPVEVAGEWPFTPEEVIQVQREGSLLLFRSDSAAAGIDLRSRKVIWSEKAQGARITSRKPVVEAP